MLRASRINKSYGSLHVLKDLELDVKSGEIMSIVGKSGTGKSTLLHILGLLDVPDSGSISIDGIDTTSLSQKSLAEFRNRKIGFIFQFHHLLAEFSALENVCIPGYIAKRDKREVEKRAESLLKYLGLSDRLSHKPSMLSGGEQQRVAIARALINDPGLILADEPTGNLDNQTSDELHELFVNLRNDFGQTYVIVTHNLELARLSDRMLEMKDGQLFTSND